MTAPTTRETADHIGEANEKVADHIGDATTMIDHAELARAIERLLPITTRNTPDYAEVSFGECQAQAMTMEPDTWLALNQLPALLSEIAALRGERDRLHAEADENGLLAYRLTQAERQRDEAVGLLQDVVCPGWTRRAWSDARAFLARLANQGADQ